MICLSSFLLLIYRAPYSSLKDRNCHEPISEPISELISEPISESVSEPLSESLSEPVSKPMSESEWKMPSINLAISQ